MGLFDFFKNKNKGPDWISTMPMEIAKLMLAEINSNPQACKLNEIPQGVGRFGIDKTNPIPVYGVPMNKRYLSSLRLVSGEKVRWRRIGSLRVENIEKLVDEYELFNMKGDTITLLYFSPYHLKTSKKAPAGFKLV